MTASIIHLIIQLVAGAGGSNVMANMFRKLDLGPMANTVVGAIGGIGGGNIASMLASGTTAAATTAASGMDMGTILTQLIASGIGGPVLTAIVAFVRNSMTGAHSA